MDIRTSQLYDKNRESVKGNFIIVGFAFVLTIFQMTQKMETGLVIRAVTCVADIILNLALFGKHMYLQRAACAQQIYQRH